MCAHEGHGIQAMLSETFVRDFDSMLDCIKGGHESNEETLKTWHLSVDITTWHLSGVRNS